MKICLNQDYVAVRRDPGKVGNTAFQDYLPTVGDPGKVGNTAQEKRTTLASPCVVYLFSVRPQASLGELQTKNPTAFAVGFSSLVARPRIELGTS